MTAVALLILLPSIHHGHSEKVLTKFLISFGVKLALGAAYLVMALKVFGWEELTSAVGVIAAYLVALAATTLITLKLQRGIE